MTTFIVDSARSKLIVSARSSIHDTSTSFDQIDGAVEADPDHLEDTGATAKFTVKMAAFDAGNMLKNRKLKKDLDLARYPTATFELQELTNVVRRDDGSFEAKASGVLRYRDRELSVVIAGTGTMTSGAIDATGSFELDIRDVGMKPPKILMFKVDPEVSVNVTLRASAK